MAQIQKEKPSKSEKKKYSTRPVRLKQSTVRKLQKILDAVNKKDFGKKVRPDAAIDLALSLVGVREIEQLRQGSMSNADRLEAAYRRFAAKQGATSKDHFLGLLLAGTVNVVDDETDADAGSKETRAAAAS